MIRDAKSVPAGTAFLVSALMIYPVFSAVSVDLDQQSMRFDFQFSLHETDHISDYEHLMTNIERGLRFAHQLLNVTPRLSAFQYRVVDKLFKASWERDMETFSEREVDVVHELLLDFCEEHEIELDDNPVDGDQFYQFEQVFDELFHQVQEMDPSVRLRAYRDMGMIYVHRLPVTEVV